MVDKLQKEDHHHEQAPDAPRKFPEDDAASHELPIPLSGEKAMYIAKSAEGRPTSVKEEFTYRDFPESPDWGLENDLLPGRNQPEYRKNVRQTCSARAFEAMKKTNLPLDYQLAIAACVSDRAQRGAKYAVFPRKIEYDAQSGGVKATYSSGPITGGSEPCEISFSPQEIQEFRIPYLTGCHDAREYDYDMQTKPHETLWKMATTSGKGDLTLHSWGVTRFLDPERVGQCVIAKEQGKVILAQFPITAMDLTDVEQQLMGETTQTLQALSAQAFEDNGDVHSLAKALENAGTNVGKLWRRLRQQSFPGAEQARDLQQRMHAVGKRIRDICDKPERVLVHERAAGKKLTVFPAEFQAEIDGLKQEWFGLLREKAELEGLARTKGVQWKEADEEVTDE